MKLPIATLLHAALEVMLGRQVIPGELFGLRITDETTGTSYCRFTLPFYFPDDPTVYVAEYSRQMTEGQDTLPSFNDLVIESEQHRIMPFPMREGMGVVIISAAPDELRCCVGFDHKRRIVAEHPRT